MIKYITTVEHLGVIVRVWRRCSDVKQSIRSGICTIIEHGRIDFRFIIEEVRKKFDCTDTVEVTDEHGNGMRDEVSA
jgi:hypothetical protein